MAVNETIVTGRKFRKCIDAATKAWQRISFWTKSSDVEFEDGKNAETKLGAIDGITDSLEDTSSRMAASAKAVSTLNNNLGGYSFGETADGKPGYRKPGADTVIPFKSGIINLGTGISFNVSTYDGYKNLTTNNFFIEYNSAIASSSGDNGFLKDQVGSTYHWPSYSISPYKSYNSATGVLTAYIDVSTSITPRICGTKTEKHKVTAYLIP